MVFDEQVGRTVYQLDDDGVVKKDGRKPQPIVEADGTGFSKEMTRKQTDSAKILWGNPAYLLATNTSAFTRYGWTAAIRGRRRGCYGITCLLLRNGRWRGNTGLPNARSLIVVKRVKRPWVHVVMPL